MAVSIQFRGLRIETKSADEAHYQFAPGINLVVGPFGSGKTSLLELLKYGLGGSGTLSQTVEREVLAVVVECRLGTSSWSVRREIGRSNVEVFDSGGVHEASLHVRGGGSHERPSVWLLRALDLPEVRVRRAKRIASGASEPVSFFDYYSYAYVPQAEIDRSIVDHLDRDRDRKRRATFEVMMRLVDERVSALEVEEGTLAEGIQAANRDRVAVENFLTRTNTLPEETLRAMLAESESDLANAQARLDGLRGDLGKAPKETADRREIAASLLGRRREALSQLRSLEAQVRERHQFYASYSLEIEKLGRAAEAVGSLAGLEYVRCPRCLQSLARERAPEGACYVCGQPEPGSEAGADVTVQADVAKERKRLEMLKGEARDLLEKDEDEVRVLRVEVDLLEQEILATEGVLARTQEQYVGPQFEAIAAASAAVVEADGRRRRILDLLEYWKQHKALLAQIRELESARFEVARRLEGVRAELLGRREGLHELSDLFKEIVEHTQLPWYQEARIDDRTYLPIVNNGSFEGLSSGGMKTVVNVAYHLALLTHGLVHSDLLIPGLLIVDSPAKNLGVSKNDRDQADRLYRRIAALAAAYEQPFQVIVADNDPPSVSLPVARRIDLSYERPLIPGVTHPGPSVTGIDEPDEADEQ
jgi:AAA domain-containing protein